MTTYGEFEAYVRRLQSEANESASAMQGPHSSGAPAIRKPQEAPAKNGLRIVRPGNPQEYRDGAMVGWRPLRMAV